MALLYKFIRSGAMDVTKPYKCIAHFDGLNVQGGRFFTLCWCALLCSSSSCSSPLWSPPTVANFTPLDVRFPTFESDRDRDLSRPQRTRVLLCCSFFGRKRSACSCVIATRLKTVLLLQACFSRVVVICTHWIGSAGPCSSCEQHFFSGAVLTCGLGSG